MRSRIRALHVAKPERVFRRESSIDLAVRAAEGCFASSPYARHEVDRLIHTGVYRDGHQIEPAMATLVQARLGLQRTIDDGWGYSFDLLNGGCGMLSAAHVVDAMISTGRIRVGLIVGSDVVDGDVAGDTAFSVAPIGVALLLEPSALQNEGFAAFAFETRDEFGDAFTADVDASVPRGRVVVARKEAALRDAFVTCAGAALEKLAHKSGVSLDALDRIVLPRTKPDIADSLAAALKLRSEQLFIARDDEPSHPLCTATFRALFVAQQSGAVAKKQKVALLSVAAGVTAGAALYLT